MDNERPSATGQVGGRSRGDGPPGSGQPGWTRASACALVVLLMLVGSACRRESTRSRGPLRKTVIACTTQPESTLVHVALARGFFREEGLDVQLLLHTFGKAAMESLLDRKAEFATVAETPIMFNAVKGRPFSVIANIVTSNENNAIVASRDAGITKASDLKGKRVGFTPGTTSDFFLDTLLISLRLSREDIRPVGLKPEDMLAAILAGKVDAVCTWNYPLTEVKRALGPKGLVFFDRDLYTETFNIAVPADLVTRDPEAVEGFLRALVKAEQFVATHPAQAQAIAAAATHHEEVLVREVWSAFHFVVQLDQTLLFTLEDETRWAMQHHLVESQEMPDYHSFISGTSLHKVRSDLALSAR